MALSVLRLFFSRLTFIYHTNLSFSDIYIYIFFQHYNFVVSTFTARANLPVFIVSKRLIAIDEESLLTGYSSYYSTTVCYNANHAASDKVDKGCIGSRFSFTKFYDCNSLLNLK